MGYEFVRPNNFVKGLQQHETSFPRCCLQCQKIVHFSGYLSYLWKDVYNYVVKFLKKTALVTISGLAHPSRISIGGFFIIAYLFVKDNRGPWAQICFAANRLCCSRKRRPNIMLKPAFKSVYLLAMLSYHKTRRHFCCCWP